MQHWLVIDLEATTEEGGWPLEQMEIIEIGASLVNRLGHEVDHFQRQFKRRVAATPGQYRAQLAPQDERTR